MNPPDYEEELIKFEAYLAEKRVGGLKEGAEQGDQGSIDWLMSRVGHCTASRFRDVMDFTKAGKPGAKRIAYMWELVTERLTGKPTEHYVNAAMERGTQLEPHARIAYERATGCIVSEPGFIHHPTIKWVGGSPDGLVDDDGGLEIKCPGAKVHLQTILEGMPEEHVPQVQGLIWIKSRVWWDFESDHPDMPDWLQLYVERIERDDDYIAVLSAEVIKFLAEVEELHQRLIGIRKEAKPVNDDGAYLVATQI